MNSEALKVLIVDDESNTRNLISMSIDWERLGLTLIGDATSGLEALDLLEAQLPDIIITDIQMPYMDGLALSRAVKEIHPDVAVVILTAHDEFSYAQSAVSIGVSDFILKPVDKALLNGTLARLAERINSQRVRLNELELSHQYIKNNLAVFQNKVLNDLISLVEPAPDFQPGELEMLDLDFSPENDFYQIALINIALEKTRYSNLERQVLLQNCCSFIKNNYFKDSPSYVFTDISNNIVLLCNDSDVSLNSIAEHAMGYFKKQLSKVAVCGIGLGAKGLENIRSSYNQALNALNLCYITGEEISFADNQMPIYEARLLNSSSLMDNMKLAIKSGVWEQASYYTRELLYNYAKENINDLDGVKVTAINISNYLKELLSEMKISYIGDLSLSGETVLNIFKHEKYSDIEFTVVSMVQKACELINDTLSSKNNTMVSEIKGYIYENLGNYELNLKLVADRFYLNSSYLSRIFKKGTGISFSDYLIKIRMEKALAMLKTHDYKAYQLAQEVGIPDPNYFVKCFKKIVGIPFAEYKQKSSSPAVPE